MAWEKLWFTARAEKGGVILSDLHDPLAFVWQDLEQAKEIQRRLAAAINDAESLKVQSRP